jgi:hypothetical protein
MPLRPAVERQYRWTPTTLGEGDLRSVFTLRWAGELDGDGRLDVELGENLDNTAAAENRMVPMSRRTKGRKRIEQAPVLKELDCTDIPDVEKWLPASSEVCYWLTLSIGTSDSEAADNFQVCVATPDGLKSARGRMIKPKGAAPPPIVLQDYSWDGVLREIDRRLAACAGTDWLAMQEKLRLLFMWEYEGYKP